MSIVCAYAAPGGKSIVFGSDRAVIDGGRIELSHTKKWNKTDAGIWVGSVGDLSVAHTLRSMSYQGFRAVVNDPIASHQFFKMRLEAAGIKKHEESNTYPGQAIIIDPGFGYYELNNCLTLQQVENMNFVAIGSGSDFAHGAAQVLKGASTDNVVRLSLMAACNLCSSCSFPTDVWNIDSSGASHEEFLS